MNVSPAATAAPAVTVRDFMRRHALAVHPKDRVFHTVQKLLKSRVTGAPVVDEGNYVIGIITEQDCIAALLGALHHRRPPALVEEVMTHKVHTVVETDNLLTVADIFVQYPVSKLPVTRAGRLVGVVSRRDLLVHASTIWEHAPTREAAILYLSAFDREPTFD